MPTRGGDHYVEGMGDFDLADGCGTFDPGLLDVARRPGKDGGDPLLVVQDHVERHLRGDSIVDLLDFGPGRVPLVAPKL
jgi:hypothetical protein